MIVVVVAVVIPRKESDIIPELSVREGEFSQREPPSSMDQDQVKLTVRVTFDKLKPPAELRSVMKVD